MAVYQKAKQEGPEFAAKYEEVLILGGSKTPHELMAIIGVDLNSKDFWEGGFRALEQMIERFETLWANSPKKV
jgi:oligoendopeptidase F